MEAGGEAEEGSGFVSAVEALVATGAGSTVAAGATVACDDLSGFKIDLAGKATLTAGSGRLECTFRSLEWGFKRIDATCALTTRSIVASHVFIRR